MIKGITCTLRNIWDKIIIINKILAGKAMQFIYNMQIIGN